ncbi:MAG: DUF2934 domain-containing protein [Candidatus Omnitrophica bacterium]|nr:DUF2934 domain-containing protein [Candidatus Omnitrophota bacterium]
MNPLIRTKAVSRTAGKSCAQPQGCAPQVAAEEVAKLAYELYQKRGGSHGDDQSDWFKAEAILKKAKARLS